MVLPTSVNFAVEHAMKGRTLSDLPIANLAYCVVGKFL